MDRDPTIGRELTRNKYIYLYPSTYLPKYFLQHISVRDEWTNYKIHQNYYLYGGRNDSVEAHDSWTPLARQRVALFKK